MTDVVAELRPVALLSFALATAARSFPLLTHFELRVQEIPPGQRASGNWEHLPPVRQPLRGKCGARPPRSVWKFKSVRNVAEIRRTTPTN